MSRPAERPEAALARMAGQSVYIDTNVFIYFLDAHPVYFNRAAAVLNACANGQILGTTGDAAVAEVLAGAYRQSDPTLATRFKHFFAQPGFLTIAAHNAAVFDAAAMLVGRQKLKFIDALHVATAVQTGCTYFATNDLGIESTAGLEVVQLSSLLE